MYNIKKYQNGLYVLHDYYRDEIDLDTALDARQLISVLVAIMPDLKCDFKDKQVDLVNLRNHMLQRVKITWKYQL